MDDLLLYFSIKYKGNWESIFKALENKEMIKLEKVFGIKLNKKSNFITILDNKYPINLKSVYKAPFTLFYFGNISLLNKDIISIFGNWKINDILDIWESNKNITLLLNLDNVSFDFLNELEKLNINYIGTTSKGIIDKDNINKISSKNLLLSEFYETNKNVDNDQLNERISIGISKKVLIKYKKLDIDIITSLEIGKIENAKLYYYGKCEKTIVENFNLAKVTKVSKIFLNKN